MGGDIIYFKTSVKCGLFRNRFENNNYETTLNTKAVFQYELQMLYLVQPIIIGKIRRANQYVGKNKRIFELNRRARRSGKR